MQIHPSRAAGPVTISRPGRDGVLKVVGVKPAGTLETVRLTVDNKRGPKPGAKKKPDASRFAESENDF